MLSHLTGGGGVRVLLFPEGFSCSQILEWIRSPAPPHHVFPLGAPGFSPDLKELAN